jgi:hypothetical protein
VPGEQHVPAWGHIHGELINRGDPEFTISEHGTRDAMPTLGAPSGEPQ